MYYSLQCHDTLVLTFSPGSWNPTPPVHLQQLYTSTTEHPLHLNTILLYTTRSFSSLTVDIPISSQICLKSSTSSHPLPALSHLVNRTSSGLDITPHSAETRPRPSNRRRKIFFLFKFQKDSKTRRLVGDLFLTGIGLLGLDYLETPFRFITAGQSPRDLNLDY